MSEIFPASYIKIKNIYVEIDGYAHLLKGLHPWDYHIHVLPVFIQDKHLVHLIVDHIVHEILRIGYHRHLFLSYGLRTGPLFIPAAVKQRNSYDHAVPFIIGDYVSQYLFSHGAGGKHQKPA